MTTVGVRGLHPGRCRQGTSPFLAAPSRHTGRVFRICQSCGRGVVVKSHRSQKCPKCEGRLNGDPADWLYNRPRKVTTKYERARLRMLVQRNGLLA